jgi:hypothetical protein
MVGSTTSPLNGADRPGGALPDPMNAGLLTSPELDSKLTTLERE